MHSFSSERDVLRERKLHAHAVVVSRHHYQAKLVNAVLILCGAHNAAVGKSIM